MDVKLPQASLSKAWPTVRERDAPPYYISAGSYTRCSHNVRMHCVDRGVPMVDLDYLYRTTLCFIIPTRLHFETVCT